MVIGKAPERCFGGFVLFDQPIGSAGVQDLQLEFGAGGDAVSYRLEGPGLYYDRRQLVTSLEVGEVQVLQRPATAVELDCAPCVAKVTERTEEDAISGLELGLFSVVREKQWRHLMYLLKVMTR